MQEECTEDGIDHRRKRMIIDRTHTEGLNHVFLYPHHASRTITAYFHGNLALVLTQGYKLRPKIIAF